MASRIYAFFVCRVEIRLGVLGDFLKFTSILIGVLWGFEKTGDANIRRFVGLSDNRNQKSMRFVAL